MASNISGLRWFYKTEEEILPYAATSIGAIAKVEVVTPPRWATGRDPIVFVFDFEARIISPQSYLDWLSLYGVPIDKVHKIEFACPFDYHFPLGHQNGFYDVSQIHDDIKCGIYYMILAWTERCLIALCVEDRHGGKGE